MSIEVRHAREEDCEQLLTLMKKLAQFEEYSDDFAVSIDDLKTHGFPAIETNKNFTAVVAEKDKQLLGYLVYYLIPFTYDLKPTQFIKELYVEKHTRSHGVGKALMMRAIEDAKEENCGRIKWDVLSDNKPAQEFYQGFGAHYDKRWQGYVLNLT